MPRVSIIMAVYNGEAYLQQALDSVVAQTYRDMEVIIVDDGSTDTSPIILAAYVKMDQRISVFHQENRGLAVSLNNALAEAGGEYIARMDADDECLPQRISKQVAYLDAHPDIGICGTWVQLMEQSEQWKYVTQDSDIRTWLLFHPQICHPSVMMRRSLIEKHNLRYNESFRYAQDYDLWVRAALFTQFGNVDSILLYYRQHPQQSSQKHRQQQDTFLRQTQAVVLSRYGVICTENERDLHYQLTVLRTRFDPKTIPLIESWLLKLRSISIDDTKLTTNALQTLMAHKWFAAHLQLTKISLQDWWHFVTSPLTHPPHHHWRKSLSLLKRVIIRKRPLPPQAD